MRCIIYLTLFGTVTAGNTKYIRRGEPIQLISYSDIRNCTEVAVYINGVKNLTLIGQWKLEICTKEELHVNPEYEGRIDMDRFRNVWILKVDGSDAATYHIKCDKQNSPLEVELNVSRELTEQDQIQKCQHDVTCMKNCLAVNSSTTMLTDQKEITEESSYHTTMTLDRKISTIENSMKEIMPLLSACIYNPVIIAILVIVVVAVVAVAFIFHKNACCQCKKNACCQCEKNDARGTETASLLESSQTHKETFVQTDSEMQDMTARKSVSDVGKPRFSLKWRFSGKTWDNTRKPWLLDLVLNRDKDVIVTDGENKELKKFSVHGTLQSKLAFQTRPDCLALTDEYLVTVTFPHETVLRVINTRNVLSVVSVIPFRPQCAGIGSMRDGRLIISIRESKSVIVCSKDGEILQEIKTDSSGETLFRKPSYVRVLDNRTIYVSDYRAKGFFIININDENTFTSNAHKISYPRSSCVVGGMLLVAASNIRLFTLDGNEAGEVPLDGVHYVRGLAISEDEQLLTVTHQSDADEEISVYEVIKH